MSYYGNEFVKNTNNFYNILKIFINKIEIISINLFFLRGVYMGLTYENGNCGLSGSDALAIMNATGNGTNGSGHGNDMFGGNNMWWIILLME